MGMGLEKNGQDAAAGILKQHEEAKIIREKRKRAGKVTFKPFTRKHKEEVRKMMDQLQRRLSRYAQKHRLNLSQIGDVLRAYLEAEGFSAWQAFLSLRGSARHGCENIRILSMDT